MGASLATMQLMQSALSEVKADLEELKKMKPKVDQMLEKTKVLSDLTVELGEKVVLINTNVEKVLEPMRKLAKLKKDAGGGFF